GTDKFWELLQDHRFKVLSVVTFLASPTGSNQVLSTPAGWNNLNNKVETIGAGGSGGSSTINSGSGTGGGGGGYSAQTNVILQMGGSATYQIGTAGVAVGGNSAGNTGGDSWFNGTT